MALESKTKDQTDIDYNGFFYASMCHVCKRFGDNVRLKACDGCRLISYCGEQHRRQHWPQHKTFCKATREVVKDEELERLVSARDNNLNFAKIAVMKAMEKKMGSLRLYEKHMFFYPKECAFCNDQESLVVCQKCAVSFCKDHKNGSAHKNACARLELCLRINLAHMKKLPSIEKIFLEHSFNTEISNTFRDMHDFITSYGNIEEVHSEVSYDVLAATLSLHLTRPLTLFYAMKILNYVPKRKELVIHVVGATNSEEHTLKMWELLLHLIPETKVSLVIVLIGKELKHKFYSLSICHNCLSRGKKISFKFHKGFYEDYVRSPTFVKPDIAVGFDADIQVVGDTNVVKISKLLVQTLAKQNCPFVVTNDTEIEIETSINNVNTILNTEVDRVFSGKNPFTSLRPCRCIISGELIFFTNKFLVIYRSLRS